MASFEQQLPKGPRSVLHLHTLESDNLEKHMSSQANTRLTAEEYLALERQAPYKNEYCNGEIFAMSGASRRHNLIALNIGAELRAQLQQHPCEVYTSAMRVKISRTGLYTYPDVVVVCEEPVYEDAEDRYPPQPHCARGSAVEIHRGLRSGREV